MRPDDMKVMRLGIAVLVASAGLVGCAQGSPVTGAVAVDTSSRVPAVSTTTSTTTAPSQGAAADGVIVWNPLPPSGHRLPVVSRAPSPDPAGAAGLPPCRASDLRVTSQTDGAAAGTAVLAVRLVATGATRCRVEGWPRVVVHATGPGAPVPTDRRPAPDSPEPPAPVAVSATRAAVLMLFWASGWCAPPVRVTGLDVVLPGGSLRVHGFGPDGCNDAGGPTRKEPIGVGPFQAEDAVPGFTGSPLADAHGKVELHGPAVPGGTLTGTLTLTAPVDVLLEPCPDLHLGVYTTGAQWESDHGLNCAAVAAADPEHRARARAGIPLRFALRWQVPDGVGHADLKVTVRLDGADGPAYGAAVAVTR